MTRVGLIGNPLEHSLSPRLHEAGFRAQGLDWSYELIEVGPDQLSPAIQRLREPEWAGANVTIPHKVAAIEMLDRLDETAQGIGAVNTIVRKGMELLGANTDAPGLLADLERADLGMAGRPCLVLGAGGAARAVAWALAREGAGVSVLARRRAQAEDLVAQLGPDLGDGSITAGEWSEESFAQAPVEALVVNATPVGMWPEVDASPWPEGVPFPRQGFIYDLVYRPQETKLMEEARAAGLAARGGLGMLVEQAALANELWTGQIVPRDPIRRTAALALEAV